MKILRAIPIFEAGTPPKTLRKLLENLRDQEMPSGAIMTTTFFVNNSSQQFVDELTLSTEGWKVVNLGKIEDRTVAEWKDKDGNVKQMGLKSNLKRYIMAVVRNRIRDHFLKSDADYLYMQDADTIIQPDAMVKMASYFTDGRQTKDGYVKDVGITCALGFKRSSELKAGKSITYKIPSMYIDRGTEDYGKISQFLFEAIDVNGRKVSRIFTMEYLCITASGFSAVMIPRHILEKIPFDEQRTHWMWSIQQQQAQVKKKHTSEDYAYCMDIVEAGYKVVLLPRLRTEHFE